MSMLAGGLVSTSGIRITCYHLQLHSLDSAVRWSVAHTQHKSCPCTPQVDPRPDGPTKGLNLRLVGRIAWAAAVSGCAALAERCASRAAASQDVCPRVWSDLARAQLSLGAAGAAPAPAAPGALAAAGAAAAGAAGAKPSAAAGAGAGAGSIGAGAGAGSIGAKAAVPAAGAAAAAGAGVSTAVRVKVLDVLEEVATAFTKLRDAEGIHSCAKLIWNTGVYIMLTRSTAAVYRLRQTHLRALLDNIHACHDVLSITMCS